MDNTEKLAIRGFLKECLIDAGDHDDFADDSSLFASGRLDSLTMTKLVLFLEEKFDIDFGTVDFDVDLVDSINDIVTFVDAELAQRA
jgi:acyl carrier protein